MCRILFYTKSFKLNMLPNTIRGCLLASRYCRQIFVQRTYKTSSKIPDLAQERHHVKRGDFSVLEDKDIAYFESVIGKHHVLQDDLQSYNIDFMRSIRGDSRIVLRPGSAEEISCILRYCNEHKLAICPQGGNTGLVGGSVPICDEIVLSLQRLNKIIKIDELTGIAICESGCILENLDNKMREVGLTVPLDLGAKSSCHIGGNISTNAGGLRVLKYGNLHGSVLGVEATLANGEILDLMTDLKKDNTGYHLKHLFIGSEGTLGVVTKVALLCFPLPQSVHVAFLGLSSYSDVLKTLSNAKKFLGEILSACEVIDSSALNVTVKTFNLNSPIENYPYYMLIETSGSDTVHDIEKFNKFLEYGTTESFIQDGTITGDPGKVGEIWKLRELAPIALMSDGFCFKYDVSVPLKDFFNVVNVVRERVGNLATCVSGYGHLGDSNLHLSVCCNDYSEELYKCLEPYIFELISSMKGSISAEHGIGFLKRNYLGYSKNETAIQMMRQIKKLLDPNGILNPYKVLN